MSQLHSTLPAGLQSRSQSLGNPELHHLVPSHLLTPGPRHSIALSPYGGGAGELPRPASGEHDHGDGALNFRAQSKEDARELQELERQLHGNFDTASGLLEHPASEPLAQATAATQDFYPTPMVGYQQGGGEHASCGHALVPLAHDVVRSATLARRSTASFAPRDPAASPGRAAICGRGWPGGCAARGRRVLFGIDARGVEVLGLLRLFDGSHAAPLA